MPEEELLSESEMRSCRMRGANKTSEDLRVQHTRATSTVYYIRALICLLEKLVIKLKVT